MNPPYGRQIAKWIAKAKTEAAKTGATCVLLIPARTDTSYWHELIFGQCAEIRFVRGRIRFTGEDGEPGNSAPFPSAIVIFRGAETECRIQTVEYKKGTMK